MRYGKSERLYSSLIKWSIPVGLQFMSGGKKVGDYRKVFVPGIGASFNDTLYQEGAHDLVCITASFYQNSKRRLIYVYWLHVSVARRVS